MCQNFSPGGKNANAGDCQPFSRFDDGSEMTPREYFLQNLDDNIQRPGYTNGRSKQQVITISKAGH